MKRLLLVVCVFALLFTLAGCSGSGETESITDSYETETPQISETEKTDMIAKINVAISDYTFTATLEDNEAAHELLEMIKEKPLTLSLSDYSGFEKVGSLGRSLTRSDRHTTTKSGDIVLYNGNNIVVFYGSNSWSYTRLGRIDSLENWEKALGSGDVTITLSI